jgi:hypothetical protein
MSPSYVSKNKMKNVSFVSTILWKKFYFCSAGFTIACVVFKGDTT